MSSSERLRAQIELLEGIVVHRQTTLLLFLVRMGGEMEMVVGDDDLASASAGYRLAVKPLPDGRTILKATRVSAGLSRIREAISAQEG